MAQYVFRINANAKLVISQGDITEFDGDAIVNAANERMLGGGGVDGGPGLHQLCKRISQVAPGVRCPTGEARITGGYLLKAKHVIHTVGPIYKSAFVSAPLLARAYHTCLALANDYGLKKIAFPAISTGTFRYPKREAAEVSLQVVQDSVGNLEEVHFVLFDNDTMDAWLRAAQEAFLGSSGSLGGSSMSLPQQAFLGGAASVGGSSMSLPSVLSVAGSIGATDLGTPPGVPGYQPPVRELVGAMGEGNPVAGPKEGYPMASPGEGNPVAGPRQGYPMASPVHAVWTPAQQQALQQKDAYIIEAVQRMMREGVEEAVRRGTARMADEVNRLTIALSGAEEAAKRSQELVQGLASEVEGLRGEVRQLRQGRGCGGAMDACMRQAS